MEEPFSLVRMVPPDRFYGLPLDHVDGRDVVAAHQEFGRIVKELRNGGGPASVWFQVERLADHSNAEIRSCTATRTKSSLCVPLPTPWRTCFNRCWKWGFSQQSSNRSSMMCAPMSPQPLTSHRQSSPPVFTASLHRQSSPPRRGSRTRTRVSRQRNCARYDHDSQPPRGSTAPVAIQ